MRPNIGISALVLIALGQVARSAIRVVRWRLYDRRTSLLTRLRVPRSVDMWPGAKALPRLNKWASGPRFGRLFQSVGPKWPMD